MLVAFVLGFVLGILALVAVEGAALLWVLHRLRRKAVASEGPKNPPPGDLDGERPLGVPLSKKGIVWILEPDKVPKVGIEESPMEVPKERKNKKNVLEVLPVKRFAEIKDQSLILSNSDDSSKITIQLVNCTVVAVSASNMPSRKWAKRYPIKLESKEFAIYNGSRILYLYLETSWEKESWCKALRLASCPDKGKWRWHAQLVEDFNKYLASLSAEYPSFLKPAMFTGEAIDRANKIDGPSKVRHFLKRLAKKASRSGLEARQILTSSSYRGERKFGDRIRTLNEVPSSDGSSRGSSEEKPSSNSLRDMVQPSSPSLSLLGNKGSNPNFLDTAYDEKFINDEGTLCWNLLFSRLFFDAKNNSNIKNSIEARIQKTLSDLRIPSYIGEVTCTGLNLGNIPPYVQRMRVFPMDLNEVWAMEVDIEYSGGILLDIETRLEVREPELQKDIIKTSTEPNTTEEMNSDLLEGIEHYGSQLKSASNLAVDMDDRNEVDRGDVLKQSKSGTRPSGYVSRWKAILHSIADQVSQVPLSLTIRVASLRGTLRLHIKPPPSDHLWFGFTSMPDIDWDLESSIGERKITSSHIAFLIASRFKGAIRDSLVLPNCESVCIPWMLGEKDDWVPRKAAPFIWVNQVPVDTSENDISNSQAEESKLKIHSSNKVYGTTDDNVEVLETIKDVVHVQQPMQEAISGLPASSNGLPRASSSTQSSYNKTNDELRVPLLRTVETAELPQTSTSDAVMIVEEQTAIPPVDSEKLKKSGRRAKMMDFGKRMGDKLEEKRRHIEERSRHIVEKMRDNAK